MKELKVGDKIWIFDGNTRYYEDNKGNKLDRCWYRGHFVERIISDETKQSWIIEHGKIKVNKKTLTYSTTNMYGKDGKLYISEEEINQVCWLNDNHYKISEMVRNCKDYNKLKQIEEILNEV